MIAVVAVDIVDNVTWLFGVSCAVVSDRTDVEAFKRSSVQVRL